LTSVVGRDRKKILSVRHGEREKTSGRERGRGGKGGAFGYLREKGDFIREHSGHQTQRRGKGTLRLQPPPKGKKALLSAPAREILLKKEESANQKRGGPLLNGKTPSPQRWLCCGAQGWGKTGSYRLEDEDRAKGKPYTA